MWAVERRVRASGGLKPGPGHGVLPKPGESSETGLSCVPVLSLLPMPPDCNGDCRAAREDCG
eukprot:364218-Chlamydomonas_euryale.AAC.10